jgi:hypothetical protein
MWGYPPILGSNQFTAHIKHKSRYTNSINYEPTDLTKGQPLQVSRYQSSSFLCAYVYPRVNDCSVIAWGMCGYSSASDATGKCWKILEDQRWQRWPEFPLKSWVPQGSISIPVAIPTSLRVRSCWPVVMRINNSSSCDRCDLDSPEVAVVLNFDGSSHGWVFQLLGRFLDKEKDGFICW